MDKLAHVILTYESDTFSAIGLGVTPQDAHDMAVLLFDRLCKVVEEGGILRSDGDVLSALLDDIREEQEAS